MNLLFVLFGVILRNTSRLFFYVRQFAFSIIEEVGQQENNIGKI